MTVLRRVNSAPASPTHASDRGAVARAKKVDPPGVLLSRVPSSSSRVSLHKRQSAVGSQYQATCISKHYALNHQIYEAFKVHYYNLSSVVVVVNNSSSSKEPAAGSSNSNSNSNAAESNFEWISGAFCLGWNFVETALLELPNHGYFYSNEDLDHISLRKRSSLAALEVTKLLQRILKLMDEVSSSPSNSSLSGMIRAENTTKNNKNSRKNNNNNAGSAKPTATDESRNDPKSLLLEHNCEECKVRLTTLRYLATEQCERLDTYEAKRKKVSSDWNKKSLPQAPISTAPSAGAGNHRGNNNKNNKSTKHQTTTNDASTTSSSRTTLPQDCDAVGETFLACSRLFCPAALSSPSSDEHRQPIPPLRSMATPKEVSPHWAPSIRNAPRSSLVDEEPDDENDNDSDSDDRSDDAVFDGSSSEGNGNRTPFVKAIKSSASDDAVFDSSPSKESDRLAATTSKTKRPMVDDTENSQRVSPPETPTRKAEKDDKKSHKQNKKLPNSKKETRNYTNWLFSKKKNSRKNAISSREGADIEKALYQSELEAAKSASMRDDESGDCLLPNSSTKSREGDLEKALYQSELQAAKTASLRDDEIGDCLLPSNTTTSSGGDLEKALYQSELEAAKTASIRKDASESRLFQSSSSSRSSRGKNTNSKGDLPRAKTGAHDYNLQHALYLSGLEVTKADGTGWNLPPAPSREANYRSNGSNQRRTSNAVSFEEEKRDDSGGEGPSSPPRRQSSMRKEIAQQVVVKGVPVASVAPVVVKGVPVPSPKDPYNALQVLKACCRKDFERLRDNHKISVTRVPTYQGKNENSTNGCTVIAPLLCIHYFQTPQNGGGKASSRLSDDRVVSVIDTETPKLIPAIRKSLGVSKNAFLIPHDANEALIDRKHMGRDQFVTVCGGNILEDGHLGALIEELSKVLPDGKKLGATFFFHQHVIAILQVREKETLSRNKNKSTTLLSFDVIDSLPNKHTLPKKDQPASPKTGKAPRHPNCARIYCKDALSLRAFLKWYACSVFNAENERYIDAYEWDEKLTDFDPRVFQAFLWKEA